MTAYITKQNLKKINDNLWEISKDFRSDMRVPARVYASEKMLDSIFKDESLEQVVNVATMPGIQKYSLAMPDLHEGYGFCLSKEAKVLSELGYYIPIKDLENLWRQERVKFFNKDISQLQDSGIIRFFKIKPKNRVLKLTAKSGQTIIATEDHPFYTKYGMKPLASLISDDYVAAYGFEGVSYDMPSNNVIVEEKNIRKIISKIFLKKQEYRTDIIIRKLKERNLLLLTYNHHKFPYLIKIAAFVFGDGSMNFIGKRGDGIIHFSGKAGDLREIKEDLEKIGYTSSKTYVRHYKTSKGNITKNHHFFVNASSLVILLETLGVPRGKKVNQEYRVPRWIFKAPLWQKRLFLATLFGCELRTPHRRLNRRGNFNAPVFPMNKSDELIKNGKDFMKDIIRLLSEFDVKVTKINQRRRYVAKDKLVTHALELIISSKPQNLINLWSKINYEYNKQKVFLANIAISYLKMKSGLLKEKEEAIKISIPALLKKGFSYNLIAHKLAGNPLSIRFIEDVCWKLKKGWKKIIPRVPPSFPTFQEYIRTATRGLGNSGLVWDKIVKAEEINFKDYVHDFTINHTSHNFFANGFLVSNCIGGVAAFDVEKGVISPGGVGFDVNCGVRLIRTSKVHEEIKDKLSDFAAQMYHEVPSGVGKSGRLKLSDGQLEGVLAGGVDKMIEFGHATKGDKEHCETQGRLINANPDLVSQIAKKRGRNQLGTIGAGNHFIEVQKVDEIFDKDATEALKLFKGQIVIMVHCGSRGLGHQVATDYIRTSVRAMSKYGIKVPDRQLACTPFNSSEGQNYWQAMSAAANYAWANRQFITWEIREAWKKIFGEGENELKLIYDVAHNLAKIEECQINGVLTKVLVHRKGATRAFPANHPETPTAYKDVGQPVLIPGSMGTASYVLVGVGKAMEETFGSSCHGAGRIMSRTQAKREVNGSLLKEELNRKGIIVKAGSMSGLAEEAPTAYKDVESVVDVVHNAGIAKKVARLRPLAVIKG